MYLQQQASQEIPSSSGSYKSSKQWDRRMPKLELLKQQQQVEDEEQQKQQKQHRHPTEIEIERQLLEERQQYDHATNDTRQVVNNFRKLNFHLKAPEAVKASPRSIKSSIPYEQGPSSCVGYMNNNYYNNKMDEQRQALNRRESPSSSAVVCKASLMTMNHQRSVDSKWWQSCWNGNQLDGELLYKTIKEQQERRLLNQHKLIQSHAHETPTARNTEINNNMKQCNSVIKETNNQQQSYVYSVPKFDRSRMEQEDRHLFDWRSAHNSSGNSPSSGSSGSTAEQDAPTPTPAPIKSQLIRDEDPLSDPLYASILGTSKQLQRINGQLTTARARPRLSSFVARESCGDVDNDKHQHQQQRVIEERNKQILSQKREAKDDDDKDGHERSKEILQKELKLEQLNDYHVYNNLHLEADESSLQLRSLVERCLEVQRATQRSSLLLSSVENSSRIEEEGSCINGRDQAEEDIEDKELEAFAREEEEIKRNQLLVGKELAACKSSSCERQQQNQNQNQNEQM